MKTTRNKKKKHDKTDVFARIKLMSIETLRSQVLIDLEISHEDNSTIIDEEENYRIRKKGIRIRKNRKIETSKINSRNIGNAIWQ